MHFFGRFFFVGYLFFFVFFGCLTFFLLWFDLNVAEEIKVFCLRFTMRRQLEVVNWNLCYLRFRDGSRVLKFDARKEEWLSPS